MRGSPARRCARGASGFVNEFFDGSGTHPGVRRDEAAGLSDLGDDTQPAVSGDHHARHGSSHGGADVITKDDHAHPHIEAFHHLCDQLLLLGADLGLDRRGVALDHADEGEVALDSRCDAPCVRRDRAKIFMGQRAGAHLHQNVLSHCEDVASDVEKDVSDQGPKCNAPRMPTSPLEHPRFGRFVYTGTSSRQAWRGHWDTLALHLDEPAALVQLEALPISLARFLDDVKRRVAAELLSHDNPRWRELTSAQLAASLTPVALGALKGAGCITVAFEEGWPVTSDVSAELDLDGALSLVGFTERKEARLTPEKRGTLQVAGLGEVNEEHDAGETRYSVKHGDVTIRFRSLDASEEVRVMRASLERIAQDAAHFAATSLAPLWNASWREEGEPMMPPSAMAAEFTLAEIDRSENGAYQVTMRDGGLFAEHLVIATFENGNWAHAGIEG